ncbi:unknown [Firmicutes bacterium CAG:449]|nr:unknown [Firmicutes bacterium CAG:449]
MKKKSLIFLLSILLIGCSDVTTSSFNDSSLATSSSLSETSSSITTSELSSSNNTSESTTSESSSSEEIIKNYSIKQINEIGNKLNNDEIGEKVVFNATYVKVMTDNFDKLMLFVDETDYLYVRVPSSQYNDYLKNRYTNCLYEVIGNISKVYDHVEVNYISLKNITTTSEKVDYSKVLDKKNNINEVIDEFKLLTLNKKNNALGKIVSVEGTVIASEYTDSNKKVVIYDGNNVLTIVNDKKIVNKDDVNKKYRFIGALSVLKGSPALWYLDSEFIKNEEAEYHNFEAVTPSYFSKWYNVSDYINNPSFDDFAKLYKVTGYVQDNKDITTAYNLGLVDEVNDSLSDVGIKKSIKGVFLMNNLSMSESDLSYSKFAPFYINGEKITVYVSLHQFDTNNHGWKVFAIENSINK